MSNGQLFEPIPLGQATFLDAPRLGTDGLASADVAVTGMVGGAPYDMLGATFPAGGATKTIREQSNRFARYLHHYDYDFGADIFNGRQVEIRDCGDVALVPGAFDRNNANAQAAIRWILDQGSIPVLFGGSHEVTIPALRAYEGEESMYIVQFDAHLDWRDEVNGVTDGLSSVMRRASEMAWVSGMAQIGLRGVGSARQEEVDAARDYGSLLIGAQEVHASDIDEIINRIPDADRYYVTVDMDGMDPAIGPAVGSPAFGGLTYYQVTNIMRGVAARGKIVGFDLPVVRPHLDVQNLTSYLAARLTLNMLGAMAHTGQIGR